MSALLIVKREEFLLEVWKRRVLPPREYRLADEMRISIGKLGYETEAGVYWVIAKALRPEWKQPNSDWVAPEDRGKVIPPGDPRNPIIAAFLKLTDDGVGIHGTNDLSSLGRLASHGCIRVHPHNAARLFREIRKGSPVVIL